VPDLWYTDAEEKRAMRAAGFGLARAGWAVQCGVQRSTGRMVGTRRLSVLAGYLGVRWRGPRGSGAWGVAHPIAVVEDVVPAPPAGGLASARWWPVPDVSLLALAAAAALLVWLLRATPRDHPRR
jgi:hypothetical protein